MKMSRLRKHVEHIFDCFCEVLMPSTFEQRLDSTSIRVKFPTSFRDAKILNDVPNFVYPCAVESSAVEHFSFLLLRENRWLYGFCRRSYLDGSSLVLLSALPWHDLMYKLLDTLHLALADGGDPRLLLCLATAHSCPVPAGGETLSFTQPDGTEFSAECPDQRRPPALLVNRNLTEYWTVIDDATKMEVFAALLHERHVLVTSARLSRLSACVQAAQALLYPLWWQRIFLPVVPAVLSRCLESPVAFLAGCPAAVVTRLPPSVIAQDCVRLDADRSRLTTPHRDLQNLPQDLVSNLRRQLKQAGATPGDGVARAFQTAVCQLVGGYRHGIRRDETGTASFDAEAFLQSQPADRRRFLSTLVNTQMFQQFIEERLSLPPPSPDSPSPPRQPSDPPSPAAPLPRRLWLRTRTMVGRRRLLSAGAEPDPPAARAATGGLQRSASSRSAPSSPAEPRLRPRDRPSELSLRGMAGRGAEEGGEGFRPTSSASLADPWTEEEEEDPLAGFSLSGGASLLEEINAELSRLRQMPLSDLPSPAAPVDQAAAAAPPGGSGVNSDSGDSRRGGATGGSGGSSNSGDSFRGGATGGRPTANGRPPLPAPRRGGNGGVRPI